ncbi:MAG: TonB family protein [Oleiphilus sp.]
MNLRLPHGLVAAFIALLFHALILIFLLNQNSQGALAEGKQGIEIGLGMLGNYGEKPEATDADVAPEKPVLDQPEQNTKTPEIVEALADTPVEKVSETPVVKETTHPSEEVIEPLQDSELLTSKLPTALPEEPAQENSEEETILVDDIPERQAKIEPEKVELEKVEPEQIARDLDEEPSKQLSQQKQTQTLQTTGEANELSNGGQAGIDQSYLAKLAARLSEHKRYPFSSRKKAEEGVAVLDFEINRNGRVLASHIQKSSGFQALDKAVLVMLKRPSPFHRCLRISKATLSVLVCQSRSN